MSRETRYDKLRSKIDRDFTRSTTLAPGLSGGERRKLVDLDEHDSSFDLDARFEKFGPFNAVLVRNLSSVDVRVYLSRERDSYVTIPSDATQAVPVIESVPKRYVRFLEVENLSGSTAVSAGDLEIQVGNELDSIELELLKDAGLLDV